jgi:hypothetical protein
MSRKDMIVYKIVVNEYPLNCICCRFVRQKIYDGLKINNICRAKDCYIDHSGASRPIWCPLVLQKRGDE